MASQTKVEGKPHIKKDGDMWLCGGFFVAPWYIDWFGGKTPKEAFDKWKMQQNKVA